MFGCETSEEESVESRGFVELMSLELVGKGGELFAEEFVVAIPSEILACRCQRKIEVRWKVELEDRDGIEGESRS